MRVKIIIVAALLVFVIGGTAAMQTYNAARSRQTAETAKQQAAIADLQKRQNELTDKVISRANALHVECLKGVKAYSLLTMTQKSAISQPICGDAFIE